MKISGRLNIYRSELLVMEEKLFNSIDEMLSSIQQEVTDEEVLFKIRTARQSLVVIKERYAAGQEAIRKGHIDDEILAALRELGYIE